MDENIMENETVCEGVEVEEIEAVEDDSVDETEDEESGGSNVGLVLLAGALLGAGAVKLVSMGKKKWHDRKDKNEEVVEGTEKKTWSWPWKKHPKKDAEVVEVTESEK